MVIARPCDHSPTVRRRLSSRSISAGPIIARPLPYDCVPLACEMTGIRAKAEAGEVGEMGRGAMEQRLMGGQRILGGPAPLWGRQVHGLIWP